MYLCRPSVETVDMIVDNPIFENDSFDVTLENINNATENSTFDQNTDIFLENVTDVSDLEAATAMPFLFNWLQPSYKDGQSEPRKPNRKVLQNMETIPRPFYQIIKDPTPTSFYATLNRNIYNANQIPHRHKLNSIQDILKYLESSEPDDDDYRPVSFKGSFRHPTISPVNVYKSKLSRLVDPFYHYKPQNPGDINLLAANTYRFSPYVPTESYPTPTYEPMSPDDAQKTSKPMSLFLDIYPMPTQQTLEESPKIDNYDYHQDPGVHFLPYGTKIGPKFHNIYYPRAGIANDLNKMVVHLNLFPKTRFLSQNRRSNPHFISKRRNFNKQPPPYKGQLLQNEEYVYKNQDFQVPPRFDRINNRKYITRNVTRNFQPNDIRPVTEPDMEVSNIEDIVNDYPTYSDAYEQKIDKRIDNFAQKFNNSKHELEFGKRLFNYKYNNKSKLVQGDAEDLQKKLFSTLPPHIIHNKYYTTTPPNTLKTEWNLNELQNNPKLINHKINKK